MPLRDDLTLGLWLDDPTAWPQLAATARSWAVSQGYDPDADHLSQDVAQAWWDLEVVPRVATTAATSSGRIVETYARTLRTQ